MRRSFLAAAVVPALAFAFTTFASTKEAGATGPTLDADIDIGATIRSYGNVTKMAFSLGGGARAGYRFNLPGSFVYMQPEAGFHYMRLGFDDPDYARYQYAATLNGGLKMGIQGIVQPNIFGHLGLGMLGWDSRTANAVEFIPAPAMDIGAGLDFRVAPNFALGVAFAYNAIVLTSNETTSTAAKWFNFTLTAGYHFGDAPKRRPVYVRRPRYY